MRRLLILFAVVAICVAGITIAVRRKSQARVGPEALLNLIGNVEREATRLPARVTRISEPTILRSSGTSNKSATSSLFGVAGHCRTDSITSQIHLLLTRLLCLADTSSSEQECST